MKKQKLTLNYRFFTGAEYVRHGQKFNTKHAKIIPVRNGFFALREFEISGPIIVTNTLYFSDLLRFYYKGYCCTVNQKNIISLI